MIKLLHLADLHIGIENYGRIDPTSGLHSRLTDYLERLDEAIAFGLREGVQVVLIAGDIYKNRSPNPTHQREFARRVHALCDQGVHVFVLTGNHDMSPSVGRAHSVEIFNALRIPGVTIADRPKLHRLETSTGPLQIVALPWVTRQGLLTRDEMRMASFSEIDQMLRRRVEAFLVNTIDDLDPTIPAVLTLHGTVEGAHYGAERGITLGQDMVLSRSMLTSPQIDYVALGHIHRHQVLGSEPPLVYAGSIERVDFGERDEDKGCVLVELERGATRWQFHALNARPFISIECDVRKEPDPAAQIAAAINKHDLLRAVVRVEIKATREQSGLLREEDIRRQLEEARAFLIASVAVEVERDTRTRLAEAEQELMKGLNPRRALELYLQKATDTDPQRIALLLAAADELLAEDSIDVESS